MPGSRRLFIVPLLLGAMLAFVSLHVSAPAARADGVPVVDQTVPGGLCVNGSIPTALGCTSQLSSFGRYNPAYNYGGGCVAGGCPIYNPITGQYSYNYWQQNYWYANDWNYYRGDSWLYCTWPGGSGWYLQGGAPSGAYCN
jgi:hypothetical protein